MYRRRTESGEYIVLSSKGKLLRPVRISGKTALTPTKIIVASEEEKVVIPLSEVVDAWVEGIISKKLFIESEEELYELQVSKPEHWAERILHYADLLRNEEKILLGFPI